MKATSITTTRGMKTLSLFDPSEKQDLEVKEKHKGRQYIFKGKKKQTKDYRGMFSSAYFIA